MKSQYQQISRQHAASVLRQSSRFGSSREAAPLEMRPLFRPVHPVVEASLLHRHWLLIFFLISCAAAIYLTAARINSLW